MLVFLIIVILPLRSNHVVLGLLNELNQGLEGFKILIFSVINGFGENFEMVEQLLGVVLVEKSHLELRWSLLFLLELLFDLIGPEAFWVDLATSVADSGGGTEIGKDEIPVFIYHDVLTVEIGEVDVIFFENKKHLSHLDGILKNLLRVQSIYLAWLALLMVLEKVALDEFKDQDLFIALVEVFDHLTDQVDLWKDVVHKDFGLEDDLLRTSLLGVIDLCGVRLATWIVLPDDLEDGTLGTLTNLVILDLLVLGLELGNFTLHL